MKKSIITTPEQFHLSNWSDKKLADEITEYERDLNYASGAWAAGRKHQDALKTGSVFLGRMRSEVARRRSLRVGQIIPIIHE